MSDTLTIMQMGERIAELEQQISILLSCKNCPDNKGGYICEKEYNDKCLSQKIQHIKELQEENAELEGKYIRVESEGIGSKVTKIGNLMKDEWVDFGTYYNEYINSDKNCESKAWFNNELY